MEFSIKLHAIKSGWSIVNIEGTQIIISKNFCISLNIDFVIANSADPNEMLGLHWLTGFLFLKRLKGFITWSDPERGTGGPDPPPP